MRSFARHRRWIGWLCAAAILCMGLAAQQHLLSHAVDAKHAAGKAAAPAEHAPACAHCLQFAGTDAAVAAPPQPLLLPDAALQPAQAPEPGRRAETFIAYPSRAPPAG